MLLIWPMRLLARRRGLAQRAPLVSIGLARRKSASHFRLQSQTKGFWARCLHRGQRVTHRQGQWVTASSSPSYPLRCFPPGARLPGHRSWCGHSQGLDGPQGGEGALGQALDLVVIEREQREVLQVLEGVCPHAVDLVGIEEPGREGGR